MNAPLFFKSTFCDRNGCVEVAATSEGQVLVRDSKDTTQPPHVFTREEWIAFVTGVKAGEFDIDTVASRAR